MIILHSNVLSTTQQDPHYSASTLVNPGFSTSMEPAQAHMVLLVSSMAGFPPILSFLAAGSQGITGMGMQEDGTNTGTGPAIFQFMGLAGELQFPKAGIFSMGMKSIWVAMGLVFAFIAMPMGSTIMSFEPDPKEHFSFAVMQTHFGIGQALHKE